MAEYFLAKSPCYKRTCRSDTFRRREIVCKHLDNKYKAGRNCDEEVFGKIAKELSSEKIKITKATYQADKAILRAAFLWLEANSIGAKAEIEKSVVPNAKAVINCLFEDGISNMAQLKLAGLSKKSLSEAPPGEIAAVRSEIRPFSGSLSTLYYSNASREIVAHWNGLFNEIGELIRENERLIKEGVELKEANRVLSNQVADRDSLVLVLEQEICLAKKQIGLLKEEIKKARSATFEQIALENKTDFPELLAIAQKMKDAREKKRLAMERLTNSLPEEFIWAKEKGKVVYEQHFLKEFMDIENREQDQILRHLDLLAKHGPDYPSLNTKKYEMGLPFSPEGSMVSNGSDEFRFSWTKGIGFLKIWWLFRKGSSQVKLSES